MKYKGLNNTFSHRFSIMRRERVIRRVLTFMIIVIISVFMMYLSSYSSSGPYRSPHSHSRTSLPQKDQKHSTSNKQTQGSTTSASWPFTSLKSNDSSNKEIHLYRILGNDLPPRHKSGQVIQNVGFILANEPTFPNTKKWWVLNRIIDPNYESALI